MIRSLLAFVLLSSLTMAQSVSTVCSSGCNYTTIQGAINASSDGDIVLVKNGTYAGFTLNAKGLSIIGEAGALVQAGASTITSLSGNGGAVLRDIELESLDITSCDDPVMIDGGNGCLISPRYVSGVPGTHPTVRITDCASVAFHKFTIEGADSISPPNEAMIDDNSLVMLWRDTVYGLKGPSFTTTPPSTDHGGHGIVIRNGASLYAEGALIGGGNGGTYICCLTASGQDAGNGIVGGTPDFLNCGFGPLAGFFETGSPGSAGQPYGANGVNYTGTPNFLSGASRDYVATSPVREGAQCTFNAIGASGETWAVIYDSAQIVGSAQLAYGGYFCVDISTASTLSVRTLPSGGYDAFRVTMPNLPTGVLGTTIFTQSLFYDSGLTYVQIAPPVPVTLLDSTL